MRYISVAIVLSIGLVGVAATANAEPAAPAKVCKSLLGKVVACPPAKVAPAKPMAAMAPVAAKPAAPAVRPPVRMAAPAAGPSLSPGGGSQTSRVGATAKCNDGTYWRSKTHSGACSRHGGVAVFY